MKSAFTAGRGFFLHLYTGPGHVSASDSEAPSSSRVHTDVKLEDLPREFLKVTKHRNTFSFTTVDLIKLNSKH